MPTGRLHQDSDDTNRGRETEVLNLFVSICACASNPGLAGDAENGDISDHTASTHERP